MECSSATGYGLEVDYWNLSSATFKSQRGSRLINDEDMVVSPSRLRSQSGAGIGTWHSKSIFECRYLPI